MRVRTVALLLLFAAPLTAQTFAVGSRVRTTGNVCARADTAQTTCGTLRVLGDHGTLVRGPAGSTTRYGLSWFVHYDTPPDGWSTAQYLTLDATPPPPPPPPPGPVPVRSITGPVSLGFTIGTTSPYLVTVKDTLGNNLLDRQVHFRSGGVITRVDSTGKTTADIRGLALGTDTVVASIEGRAWSTPVTVMPPNEPPPPPVLLPLFVNNLRFLGAIPIFPGTWSFTATDSAGHAANVTITITTKLPNARRRVRRK